MRWSVFFVLILGTAGCGAQVASVHAKTSLRQSADAGATSIGTVPEDAIVTLVANAETWLEIEYEGKTGFIPRCLATPLKKKDVAGFQARTGEAANAPSDAVISRYADTKYYAAALASVVLREVETGNGDPIQTLAKLQQYCPERAADKLYVAVGQYAHSNDRMVDAVNAIAKPHSGTLWIGVNKLSLRYGPARKSKRLSVAGYGTTVQATRRFGPYRLIKTKDGRQGWVSSNFLTLQPPLGLRREYTMSPPASGLSRVKFAQKGPTFTGTLVNSNGREVAKHRGTVSGDDIQFNCLRRRSRGRRCNFKGQWQNGVIVGRLVYVDRGKNTYRVTLTPR